ncbi:penicillin-binding protein 1C [bacterium AH-315-B15]|nr:penicillin-binding protein 1C [bacterium AH-315-B15]
MKFIKKIAGRFWRFLKRFKFLISGTILLVFLIWLFCLPSELFNDPTSTVIYDRNGNLIGASIADDEQWRFPYNPNVPDKFKAAVIQFEDRSFESHWGVSLRGMGRAMYQNIKGGKRVSGGSTITMQVMRLARKGKSRNIWQKVVEIFWATRSEWRYSKSEILALWANNAPMGGNVVGLDAAAWRYFGRPSDDLTWAESATLAVLPNAPSLMHPGKNRGPLLEKRNRLLDRLYEVKEMDSLTWVLSKLEPLPEEPHPIPMIAPQLYTRIINDGKKGQIVYSTLDISVQERVNTIVQFHHEKLSENEIHNAAVLVMELESGDVIAYTGNVPDLAAEHGKDVDIIMAPRSTGSILKPFLYAGMLESGDITPEMLVQDIPTVMSGYSPKNYNLKYDGVVAANQALSRSLNVPLVRMLTKFSVQKLHYLLRRMKFETIRESAAHYGLSLILGGAEVTLWDLVSAYGIMARCVTQYPNIQPGVNKKPHYNLGGGSQDDEAPILNPASCWFTLEAMKEVSRPDEDINWELFSTSQQIAWKTGTSFGFRDAWAVGCTPRFVVGVWVGNADGEGRPGLIGREAAAPILFDVFSSLPQSEWFDQPYDEMAKVEICDKSGYRANEACEHVTEKWIPKSSLNTVACPYHDYLFVDQNGEYQVNASCYEMSKAQKKSWFKLPAVAEYFYKNRDPNYLPPPPFDPNCEQTENKDELAILYPKNNSRIYVPVNFNEEKEKIVFEATHIRTKMKLFWQWF